MCLLQAQNWVLSFPGGDGGGGIPLAFPAAVATVYSVSGCRRAQETNQTPSYLSNAHADGAAWPYPEFFTFLLDPFDLNGSFSPAP